MIYTPEKYSKTIKEVPIRPRTIHSFYVTGSYKPDDILIFYPPKAVNHISMSFSITGSL